jgi:sirohydrochlorin ferrochelatase
MPKVAYLLVVHGSHHPSYNAAVKELTVLVQERAIARSQTLGLGRNLVDVAFLEVHPLPLHEQILAFADRAAQEGISRIQLLPLFLLPGVHVREDIPAEVAIARNLIDPKIALELLPYLGTQQKALSGLLLSQMAAVNDSSAPSIAILFSHGSRRPGGNQPVEAIANYLAELSGLEVVTAYSFVAPFLGDRLAALNSRRTVKMGDEKMVILPYVLFPGELTAAIADSVTQLCRNFEHIQIKVAQPIAASNDFAELIFSMAEN